MYFVASLWLSWGAGRWVLVEEKWARVGGGVFEADAESPTLSSSLPNFPDAMGEQLVLP